MSSRPVGMVLVVMTLSVWSAFGPDIVGAIVGGVVAGLTAFLLLKYTQTNEANIRASEATERASEERKKTARLLIVQVRDLRDLLESNNLSTVRGAPTYGLRNQVATAQFELGGQPVLARLGTFATYCRNYRDWIRHVSKTDADQLEVSTSSAYQQWKLSRGAIVSYADALVNDLLAVGGGTDAVTKTYPELPAVPPVLD